MFCVNLHRSLAGYPWEFLGGSCSFSGLSAPSSTASSSPAAALIPGGVRLAFALGWTNCPLR